MALLIFENKRELAPLNNNNAKLLKYICINE